MVSPARQEVYGPDGLIGTLVHDAMNTDGETVIELTEGGGRALVSRLELKPRSEGGFYLPIRSDDLRRASPTEQIHVGQTVTVPVAREEIAVSKEQRESGRVVVHITPSVRRELVDLPTVEEHVDIFRVPVNRFVDAAEPVRQEGDVTIVPVYEEVVVVERRLMLKEEVRIARRRTVHQQIQEVELRSDEVHVLRSKNNS